MIDHARFAAGMAILAGNFSRTLDPALLRVYYRAMSAALTTNQFEQAVARCIDEDTFWPSCATIIGKVKCSDEEMARLAFEHVCRVVGAHGGYRFLPHDVYQREFDDRTKVAICAVGGLADIANTTLERWGGLIKRFVTAHVEAGRPREVRQIASGQDRRLGADA